MAKDILLEKELKEGDIIVIQDADLEYDPNLLNLLNLIKQT